MQRSEVDRVPDEGEVPVRAAVSDWPSVAAAGDSLVDALDRMKRSDLGTLPVLAPDGTFAGLLVRRDLMETLRAHLRRPGDLPTVGEVCRPGVCVGLDAPIPTAIAVLDAERVGRIPVVDGRELAGCITREDIEEFLDMRRRFHRKYRVAELPPRERAQLTWRLAQPDAIWTTWGIEITGEAFIAKAESYADFDPAKAILEIGPGYGRLLRECLRRELPFRRYVAVDISPANAKHLAQQFGRDDIDVVNDDIETVDLGERFDIVLSSLTLKHLYPSFEAALRNVERQLNPGATLIFDVLEGEFATFTPADGVSYVRGYTREELQAMLSAMSLQFVAFDEVEHAPGQVRLLVVARKPA